jgi:hypothetical protein
VSSSSRRQSPNITLKFTGHLKVVEASKSRSKDKHVLYPNYKPGTIVNARRQNLSNIAPVKEVVIMTEEIRKPKGVIP